MWYVSDYKYHKELLLKERICSLWEQILSFKRSSHFEKGCNWREPLLASAWSSSLPFDVRDFFSVLAMPLRLHIVAEYWRMFVANCYATVC